MPQVIPPDDTRVAGRSMTQIPTQTGEPVARGATTPVPEALALVIAWSPAEADRIGEIGVVPATRTADGFVLGRGAAQNDPPRLQFVRSRAGAVESRPDLGSPRISRVQLSIRADGLSSLAVNNLGRCALFYNGAPVESARVIPGDTLQIGQELLLLCTRRPAWLRPLAAEATNTPFGAADTHGIVGESPAAWELRRQIVFAALRESHVLIVGESGTGKELTARAIHALSARAAAPFHSRNAATFPEGLVDAELFGHARNYPNTGMPERQGLIGNAAGATLFLDELAELSPTLQTHLLRVLDSGEYQRLGDGAIRVSDFRLIAATNAPSRLREDLAARFKLSIEVPNLNARPEDVPLLIVHLLRGMAVANADIAARLFPDADLRREPRVAPEFVDVLLRRRYRTHVRELEQLLWRALSEGPEHVLDGTARPASAAVPKPSTVSPRRNKLSASAIEAALVENDWNLERTWRALALSSRHALARLITKHGLRKPRTG
jgi:DNA-binding NtrC family response regulator